MVVLGWALGSCCCCVTAPLRRWLRVLKQIVLACARFYLWTVVLGQIAYLIALFLFGPVGAHWDTQSAVRAMDLEVELRLRAQSEILHPTLLDNVTNFWLGVLSVLITTLRTFLALVSAAKSVTPAMQPATYERVNQFWTAKVDDMVRSITSGIIWAVDYVVCFIYTMIEALILPLSSLSGNDSPSAIYLVCIRLGLLVALLILVSKTPTLCKRPLRHRGREEDEEEEADYENARAAWRRRWRDHSAPPSSRTRGRSRDRRREVNEEEEDS